MNLKNEFSNSKQFSLFIEEKAAQNNISCLDALIEFCRKNKLEPEEVTKWVNKNLKSKLEKDFQELNYIPKNDSIYQ